MSSSNSKPDPSNNKKPLFIDFDTQLEELWDKIHTEFRRACQDKKHPFRFVTLGSQTDEGVGLRYVVLREITANQHFLFYTDYRSPKVKELEERPNSSLLFYHPQKGVQIRVEGKVGVHHQDSICADQWKKVQGIAQRAYTPLIQPGEVIESPQQAHEWPVEMRDEYFSVLEFSPNSYDILQLNRLEHLRLGIKKEGETWKVNWLAP
ncbi:MAG: pyridoxamine 5'-phosphate oxidase family protein [Bacteroidota bacterium]